LVHTPNTVFFLGNIAATRRGESAVSATSRPLTQTATFAEAQTGQGGRAAGHDDRGSACRWRCRSVERKDPKEAADRMLKVLDRGMASTRGGSTASFDP
jgi:hypothetical protein